MTRPTVIVAHAWQLLKSPNIIIIDIPENPEIFDNQTKFLQISQDRDDYEAGFVDNFGSFHSENNAKNLQSRNFSVQNQELSPEVSIYCSAFLCEDIKILGVRHGHIWELLSHFPHLNYLNHSHAKQGFVTKNGKFLDRTEARNIFVSTGQKGCENEKVLSRLFSENLY